MCGNTGRQAELADVRQQVRRDWFAERRAASKEQFFAGLLKKYDVTVEPAAAAESESNK